MEDEQDRLPEPANLRFLRILVTVLTAVMIGGVVTIVLLLVIKLGERPALPALPASLVLPDGAVASAVTYGPGWIAVIDRGQRVLLYDNAGSFLGESAIELPAE